MYHLHVAKHYKFTHSRRKRQYNYHCVVQDGTREWEWWQHSKPTRNDVVKYLEFRGIFIFADELKYLEL